jgi:hypothetical protein
MSKNNFLLTDAGNHLRDVDERALRPGSHHSHDVVRVFERGLRLPPRVVPRLVQDLVDLVLERLHHRPPRLRLELAGLQLLRQSLDLGLGALDRAGDDGHGARVGDGVPDADREAVLEQPVVGDVLMWKKSSGGVFFFEGL